MGDKAARRHWLITVDGVDGTFATCTGGNVTSDATKVYDGGADEPDVMTSPRNYSDIVVGRAWERGRDGAVVKRLRPGVRKRATTVHKKELDDDMVPTGYSVTYFGKLTGLTDPDADAGSGDPSRLELTIAVSKVS